MFYLRTLLVSKADSALPAGFYNSLLLKQEYYGIDFVPTIVMMARDRIWQLITKKMMREASLEEQDELKYLLKDAPLTLQLLQTLTQLWEFFPNTNKAEANLAFEKLREKIYSSEELLGQIEDNIPKK